MLKEFRDFAFKGNLLEIAIGLVLALFFTEIVTALIDGVIMPFIAAIFGEPNFDAITWTIGDDGEGVIEIGRLVTALVNFVLVAWVLFLILKAANRLRREQPQEPAPSEDVVLLREIRDLLARR